MSQLVLLCDQKCWKSFHVSLSHLSSASAIFWMKLEDIMLSEVIQARRARSRHEGPVSYVESETADSKNRVLNGGCHQLAEAGTWLRKGKMLVNEYQVTAVE